MGALPHQHRERPASSSTARSTGSSSTTSSRPTASKHDLPLATRRSRCSTCSTTTSTATAASSTSMQERGLVERMCTDADIDTAVDDAAADDAGPAARRVHPPGQGAQARLHGRLGAPEAQRPGPAHGAVQGPVQVPRRAGREAHRVAVTAFPKDYETDPARFAAARESASRWSTVGDVHPRVAARFEAEQLEPVLDIGCGDGALRMALVTGVAVGRAR